jgi:hypothetical protein
MAQVIIRQLLTMKALVQSQASYGMWWEKRWNWDGVSSEYFSFLLSVSFHKCAILIHSSTTNAV